MLSPTFLRAAPLLAATAVSCALPAWAQSQKPGLWEITQRVSGSAAMDRGMADMQKQLAAMPPQQRKAMEDMLAKQGIALGGAPGAMAVKVCMTREMIDRNEMPTQQDGDCKTTQTSRSGNTMKMSFVCTRPPGSGEGVYTFTGDTGFSSTMVVTTTRQGKPETMNMSGTGKWLGADCGNIKPLAPAK